MTHPTPHHIPTTNGYSRYECVKSCINSFDSDDPELVENGVKCRCRQLDFQPRSVTKPVCSPWKSVGNCNATGRAHQCMSECHDSCTQDRLDIKKTSLNIDKQVLQGLLGGNLTDSELAWFIENHTVVHIAYHGSEYTEINQYFLMKFGTLMSNFGGMLGLLLGASVLTVL